MTLIGNATQPHRDEPMLSVVHLLLKVSLQEDYLLNDYVKRLTALSFKPISIKHRLDAVNCVLNWLRSVGG
jgi:hypothetical protein